MHRRRTGALQAYFITNAEPVLFWQFMSTLYAGAHRVARQRAHAHARTQALAHGSRGLPCPRWSCASWPP
jgi:hypothetical protein